MASTYTGHLVICGMGRVGYRVTQESLRFGREVVGTEIDLESRFVERAKALGCPS